eukprot:scaffold126983_cov37-Tisochrysis_lutea.AAC.1
MGSISSRARGPKGPPLPERGTEREGERRARYHASPCSNECSPKRQSDCASARTSRRSARVGLASPALPPPP